MTRTETIKRSASPNSGTGMLIHVSDVPGDGPLYDTVIAVPPPLARVTLNSIRSLAPKVLTVMLGVKNTSFPNVDEVAVYN